MTYRWGLGPVFFFEWLLASRRWQMYATRSLFVTILLIALSIVGSMSTSNGLTATRTDLARIGESIFYALIGTQLTLVLLAAPAATAGAVCQDKARGALQHLLMTDLSSAEIILGKLAARLVPVFGLVLCALPVLALCVLLGGIDPGALLGALLVTLGVAVLGCALALTLSVWGSKTHEVLLLNYLFWSAALLAYPTASSLDWHFSLGLSLEGLAKTNPFLLAFLPYIAPGTDNILDCVLFLAGCLVLSAVLAFLAIVSVRAVAIRHGSRSMRRTTRRAALSGQGFWRFFGPSLDGNPVLWREWHRKRPSSWVWFVWICYTLGAVVFTALVVLLSLALRDIRGMRDELAPFVNAFLVGIGLLLLSVTASTSLAEERARGSLDVLLTTPLSTGSIIWGKWWAAFRTVPLLAILPTFSTVLLGLSNGRWPLAVLFGVLILAFGAAITSLGLVLATWIARPGRAVAACVTIYVLVTVGWPCALLGMSGTPTVEGIAIASPFFCGGQMTADVQHGSPRDQIYFWAGFWIFIYLLGAAILATATLVDFDRRLGRMTARRRPSHGKGRHRLSAVPPRMPQPIVPASGEQMP
jgi:ABC-type transport system involved in multi-copper enzyme maturation permease subunit